MKKLILFLGCLTLAIMFIPKSLVAGEVLLPDQNGSGVVAIDGINVLADSLITVNYWNQLSIAYTHDNGIFNKTIYGNFNDADDEDNSMTGSDSAGKIRYIPEGADACMSIVQLAAEDEDFLLEYQQKDTDGSLSGLEMEAVDGEGLLGLTIDWQNYSYAYSGDRIMFAAIEFPAGDLYGTVEQRFFVTLNDHFGGAAPPVNNPPIWLDASFIVGGDEIREISVNEVASDPDGDDLFYGDYGVSEGSCTWEFNAENTQVTVTAPPADTIDITCILSEVHVSDGDLSCEGDILVTVPSM